MAERTNAGPSTSRVTGVKSTKITLGCKQLYENFEGKHDQTSPSRRTKERFITRRGRLKRVKNQDIWGGTGVTESPPISKKSKVKRNQIWVGGDAESKGDHSHLALGKSHIATRGKRGAGVLKSGQTSRCLHQAKRHLRMRKQPTLQQRNAR